jgi:hypothetical protein
MKHILITKTYKKQRIFATLSTQRYLYWVELVDSWLDSDVKKQLLVLGPPLALMQPGKWMLPPGALPGQLSPLNSGKQPGNRMPLPGVLLGQLNSLNNSTQPGNEMPLPGVLPGQLSSLNNSKQPGNMMLLPGVLPGQPSLLNSNMQSRNGILLPGEGLVPGDLGSKPCTLRMRWRGWWYTH